MTDRHTASHITGKTLQYWCIALCLSSGLAAYAFYHLDVPVARALQMDASRIQNLADGMAGRVLVAGEALVILLLVALRLIHGKLPKIAEVLAIACLSSICCYALNSFVLKCIFGVPNPTDVLITGTSHAFHWLQGTDMSSFPSGHMMLAASFGGVFMHSYPKLRKALSALLLFGMCLLVAGNWHFISDVIIGTFCGVTAGLIAGEVWSLHLSES